MEIRLGRGICKKIDITEFLIEGIIESLDEFSDVINIAKKYYPNLF